MMALGIFLIVCACASAFLSGFLLDRNEVAWIPLGLSALVLYLVALFWGGTV